MFFVFLFSISGSFGLDRLSLARCGATEDLRFDEDWGIRVQSVDPLPGQPGLAEGDFIVAIDGAQNCWVGRTILAWVCEKIWKAARIGLIKGIEVAVACSCHIMSSVYISAGLVHLQAGFWLSSRCSHSGGVLLHTDPVSTHDPKIPQEHLAGPVGRARKVDHLIIHPNSSKYIHPNTTRPIVLHQNRQRDSTQV